METSIRRLPKSQVEVTLALSADEVDRVFDKVYRELAEGPIPGFRPGKAPRIIIRRRFGEDRISSSVLGKILEEQLPKAIERVEQEELKPIGEPVLPDLEEIRPAEGEGLTIPVIVSVYPEPQFDDLSGIKLLRPVAEVSDEDVEGVISDLLDAHADWVETTRAIAPGDRVQVAVQRTVEGQVDIDVSEAEVTAAEPDNEQADVVLRKIVGHIAGQTVEFDYEIPQDADDEAAGKTAHYKVVIQRVWEKKLPELTDEFVKEHLDFESVEELRKSIRQDLEKRHERRAFEELRSQAVAHLLARCDMELPDVLVEGALQERLSELEEDLGEIGTSLAELAESGQIDQKQFVEGQRQRVVLMLETKIALDALAEREELEAEEEDIQAEIEALARRTNNTVAYIRQAYEVQPEVAERIDNAAKTRRVIRWLIERAEVEDVPANEYEEKARQLLDELRKQREERRKKKAEGAEKDEAEQAAAEEEAVAEGAQAQATSATPEAEQPDEEGSADAPGASEAAEAPEAPAAAAEGRKETDAEAERETDE